MAPDVNSAVAAVNDLRDHVVRTLSGGKEAQLSSAAGQAVPKAVNPSELH